MIAMRRAVRFRTSGIYAVLELDDGTEVDLAGCEIDIGGEDDILVWLSSQMDAGERYDAAKMFDPDTVVPGMCDCDCAACLDCTAHT